MRILLIEDDERLADRTAEYLRGHQAQVDIVGDGVLGLARAAKSEHDIILLDIMLPGIDGLELCKELRKHSKVPVIMLSARGEEVDRVVGLELGADDYLPKPFSPRELLARIRAVLRRNAGDDADRAQIEIGSVTINRERHTVDVAGSPCELTAYQFDLLWVLASSAAKVMSRAQLYARVRELRNEPPQEFDPSIDRSIDVHLSKVRQAVAALDEGAAEMIKTVRGVGYVVDPERGGE